MVMRTHYAVFSWDFPLLYAVGGRILDWWLRSGTLQSEAAYSAGAARLYSDPDRRGLGGELAHGPVVGSRRQDPSPARAHLGEDRVTAEGQGATRWLPWAQAAEEGPEEEALNGTRLPATRREQLVC